MVSERLRQIRHVALDMDGTIYCGSTLFDGTKPFLELLERRGIGYSFATNNSSRSVSDYVEHLQQMGLSIEPEQMHTSTLATLRYLRNEHPGVKRLFVLGTPNMQREMEDAGYELVACDGVDEPDAVVVGFDTTLAYERLCCAAYWIQRGALFIATHPDRFCPTDRPTCLVDCGALCACLKEATGRGPDAVLGKPSPLMIESLMAELGFDRTQVAMIGDRLTTDIGMANQAGVFGILVLTGETRTMDQRVPGAQPDLVVPGLDDLAILLGQLDQGW